MDAYQAGWLDLPGLHQRLQGLDLRTQQWGTEADRLAQLQQAAAGEEDLLRRLDTLAARVRGQLDRLGFAGRQALLRDVLDHVEASLVEVTLYFAIPLPPDEASPPSDPDVSSRIRSSGKFFAWKVENIKSPDGIRHRAGIDVHKSGNLTGDPPPSRIPLCQEKCLDR